MHQEKYARKPATQQFALESGLIVIVMFIVSAKQIYCSRARNCKCNVSVSVMLAYSQSLNA